MQQIGIGADARIIFITHRAREADLRATVHALRDVKSVHRVGSVLRVMGDERDDPGPGTMSLQMPGPG